MMIHSAQGLAEVILQGEGAEEILVVRASGWFLWVMFY